MGIGRQCGIVALSKPVLLGELLHDGQDITWRDPDDEAVVGVDPTDMAYAHHQLAVTQGAWRQLFLDLASLEPIWTRIVVFARMKPEDKINVVKYFQSRNLVVGMCGDGGNDCGGLRAAHAGLALSDAEASMVSPFSTGRDGKSLMTVVDLVREGRACLSTNLATFQYFIVYGIVLTGIRTMIAVYAALSMGEYVWVTIDVGVGMIMVWTMTQSKPTEKLVPYRPTATLLGARTLGAIAFPIFTSLITLVLAEAVLWERPWYVKMNPLDDIHLLPSLWMLRGDNYDSAASAMLLMLSLANTAYVNTYGGAFRRNILRNIGVNVVYALFLIGIFWMLLMPPSQFGCVYRVNCATENSLAAKDLTLLALFSAGGVGGCFLGPQVGVWQEEMHSINKTAPWWLPQPENDCLPPAGLGTTPLDSPLISHNGCSGPNNCFAQPFRWTLAGIFAAYILANHLFTKVVLQGYVSARIRRWQRCSDANLYDVNEDLQGELPDSSESSEVSGASSRESTDSDLQLRS